MFKSRKLIATLMIVAMLLSMIPMTAFAATSNNALTVPSVGTGSARDLGTVRIIETEATQGSITAGTEVTFILGDGLSWAAENQPTAATLSTFINIPQGVGTVQNSLNHELTSHIRSSSSINAGTSADTTNTVVVTLCNDTFTAAATTLTNWTVTGATLTSVTVSGNQATLVLTGAVTATDTITVKANAAALTSNADSNTLTFQVGAEVTSTPVPDDVIFVSSTNKTLTVRVTKVSNAVTNPASRAIIEFKPVKLDVSGSGPAEVEVFSTSGAITNGKVVVGQRVGGGTTAVALSAPGRTEGNDRAIGAIRIVETTAGSLEKADNSISLTLPTGYTWNKAPTVTLSGGFAPGSVTVSGIDKDANGYSRVRLNVVKQSTGQPGVIELTGGTVDIANTAAAGDAVLRLGGSNVGITAQDLVVVKKVSFGSKVEAVSAPVIYAGANSATIGDIKISEDAAGSIISNRTIRLVLPENAEWATVPTFRRDAGDIAMDGVGTIVENTNKREVVFTVGPNMSKSASTFRLAGGEINVQPDAKLGDLIVKVEGTATVAGEVKVAEIKAPVTVTAENTKNVIIGKQAQLAGDIVIKEAEAATIKAIRTTGGTAYLDIHAPAGVTFASVPKVEVTEGNLVLDTLNITRLAGNSVLSIPVRAASTTASTIKISGIQFTVTRDVPEGNVTLGIRGSSIDRVNDPKPAEGTRNAATVVATQVVTPAPGDLVAKETVFNIGSTTYTVDGVEQTMDVAPYIKDNRTFVPVRFAAQAMGVAEKDIIWDGAKGTATLFKGDRIIQMTIGSNIMTVNGVQITMDTAPEIVNNRTMLPVGWLAQALNVVATWDGAAQTATLTQAAVVE